MVVVTHRPLPDEWLVRFPDAPFHTAGSVESGIALAKKLAGDGLGAVRKTAWMPPRIRDHSCSEEEVGLVVSVDSG